MTKLEISGKYEIGNGYNCHCCRQTYEQEFDGLYLNDLIEELSKQSSCNDGDVSIDPDNIAISNMGAHHDQYYIKEEIVKRCEAAIKQAYEIKKLKTKIESTQRDLNTSKNWIASIEQQREKHVENITAKQKELASLTVQLQELIKK
jgi:hypothetical protein